MVQHVPLVKIKPLIANHSSGCETLYDCGTLFASVQLYAQRFLSKIDRNDGCYARRRRNYSKKVTVMFRGCIPEIKVNLRTIIRVNPTVQKCRSALSVMLVLTNEKLLDRYKQEHSRLMNPVLEEVSPNLKSIRNCLFGLSIKKIPQKANRHSIKATNAPQVTSAFNFSDKNNFKKTGKVSTQF